MRIFAMRQIDEMLQHASATRCDKVKITAGRHHYTFNPSGMQGEYLRQVFNAKMDEMENGRDPGASNFHNVLVEAFTGAEVQCQMVLSLLDRRPCLTPTFIDALVGEEVTEEPGFWNNKKV